MRKFNLGARKKVLAMLGSLLFASPVLAAAHQLVVEGASADVVTRSPIGVQIGIAYSDNVIINPSFSRDELINGELSKTIHEEEGHKIVSCTYSWLIQKEAGDIYPAGFQGSQGQACLFDGENYLVKAPIEVKPFTIYLGKSAFEHRKAKGLYLFVSARDSIGSHYNSESLQASIDQLPTTLSMKAMLPTGISASFLLKPLWVTNSGAEQEDPIEFSGSEYRFE